MSPSAAEDYAAPVLWGTFGIGHREDLVPEPIVSWMQLLEPTDELQGKIVMIRQLRDLIGVALKALGYSLIIPDRLSSQPRPSLGPLLNRMRWG